MILPGSASLILSAVQQLIKLGGRIDGLMAQRTAVQSNLVLGMPSLQLGNLSAQVALVRQTLAATAGQSPDPFGTDRAALQQQVTQAQPDPSFDDLFAKYFPDAAGGLVVTPDAAYLAQLQQAFPGLDWTNPGVRIAAFAIAAGSDDRQVSYSARVALAVFDTLLEFGANNTSLFVRDPKLSGVVQVVLQRFAQPDWAGFEQWNPLLQAALKATLNAALDVGQKLPSDNPWLAGTLDALIQARTAAADPDDYLMGLLQGRGVNLFLAKGLLVASDKLSSDQSNAFKQVAGDVLASAIPFVQDATKPQFRQFFNDHWGDLLRAGLSSLDQHGDAILGQTNPLLGSVLKAIVAQLATTPNAGFLSNETLFQLADTVIGAVAANPAEVAGLATKPWLAAFLNSAAQTAQQLTVKKLFTPAAAEALMRDAVGVLAKYPQLVVSGNGLPLTLATSVFTALSQLQRIDARTIGETAVRAALSALATDPSLTAGRFGPVVTAVATQLSTLVGQGKFTADQAASIASAAIAAIANNPQIYAGLQKDIAGAVVSAVQQAIPASSPAAPWAGRLLAEIANQTLIAVARHGASVAQNQTVAQLQQLLTTVLGAGLTASANQLGTSVDLDGVAPVIGGLVAQALRGDLTAFDPGSPAFTAAYQSLAAALPASIKLPALPAAIS